MRRSRAHPRALQAAYDHARDLHPQVEVKFTEWRDRVRLLVTRRSGQADAQVVEAVIAASHVSDLYLAIACDLGHDDAWTRLLGLYESQIADHAASLTIGLPKRDRFVADFLADLFRSAGVEPPMQTRLGLYDGSASLRTWLLVELNDKVLRARERLLSVQRSGTQSVVRRAVEPEEGTAVRRVLTAAWQALDPETRLALGMHLDDGLAPAKIASILRQATSKTRQRLHEGLEALRQHSQEALADQLTAQAFVDVQRWFERALNDLLQSGRPKAPSIPATTTSTDSAGLRS